MILNYIFDENKYDRHQLEKKMKQLFQKFFIKIVFILVYFVSQLVS